MKRFIMLGFILSALLTNGCAADKSQELYETAQLEEKQSNAEHAKKLYEEIMAKYPNSPVAKQAQERLNALKGK